MYEKMNVFTHSPVSLPKRAEMNQFFEEEKNM